MSMPAQKPGRSRQDYATPPELLTALKRRLGIEDFTIDLAATEVNAVAPVWVSGADDALQEWNWHNPGWSWLNPPFAHIAPWVEKAWASSIPTYGLGLPISAASIAMLVPASVGSNWWATWVDGKAHILFLRPRLTFVGARDPYPKDCAILLYTPQQTAGYECWNWKGL